MLDLYAFYVIFLLTLISALLIFVQRKLVKAVIALTGVFVGTAMLFMLLSQTMIALLMLIIFVGGLSTYLIVAVGSEEKNTKFISVQYFGLFAAVFFAVMSLTFNYLPTQSSSGSQSFLLAAQAAFQSDYAMLYMIVILLFAVTLGSTIIIKKFSKLIV